MKVCIIVFADERMLRGAETLCYSLRKYNRLYDTKIIALSDSNEVLQSNRLIGLTDEQRLVDASLYKSIVSPKGKRKQKNFMKGFEAFRDYGCDRNILMDADLLCLNSIDDLFIESEYDLGVVRDISDRVRRHEGIDADEFNSGMMCIHKNLMGNQTVKQLIDYAVHRKSYNGGDQGILNVWAYEQKVHIHYLPDEFNLLKKVAQKRINRSGISVICNKCRLLHYHTRKPWENDHHRYEVINRIWHDFYEEMTS